MPMQLNRRRQGYKGQGKPQKQVKDILVHRIPPEKEPGGAEMEYPHRRAIQPLIAVEPQLSDQVEPGREIQTGIRQENAEIRCDKGLFLTYRIGNIDDKVQKIKCRSEGPSA